MNLPSELPIAQCHLDPAGMREQADRYRRLGETTTSIQSHESSLVVTFDGNLDEHLLEQTVAVERGCCPFFSFDYRPSARRLVISVQRPDQTPALDALHYALTARPASDHLAT